MVRPIQVRSREDLGKLAAELDKQFTIVFSDDDHFLAMKDGRIVKRFRTNSRSVGTKFQAAGNLGDLPSNGHVFLIYGERDSGANLETSLLMDGLSKGERCVYATHQDVNEIESQLSKRGFPIEEAKAKKMITFLKVEDPFQGGGAWSPAIRRIVERIMSYGPDRVVSWRWIRDLSDPRQVLANKQVERLVDAAIRGESVDPNFEGMRNFGGLFVCSYFLGGPASQPPTLDWLANHLSSHDATMLAGKDENVLLARQSG